MPILRRHSLWTAPKNKYLSEMKFGMYLLKWKKAQIVEARHHINSFGFSVLELETTQLVLPNWSVMFENRVVTCYFVPTKVI